MSSHSFVVGNGIVADGLSVLQEDAAILVENGTIKNIGKTNDIKNDKIEFYDVKGRLILPGFLNTHHHLYSFLAPGAQPKGPTPNFVKILKNFWWPWDEALTKEVIYYSALAGIIEAVKHGVTSIFDHHASMSCVSGSLNELEKAFKQANIKALLAYETSNRHGFDAANEHIKENLNFYNSHKNDTLVKGMFGLHANLTLDEKLLKTIQNEKPKDLPIHIHCGEDRADLDFCIKNGYNGPVDRLYKHKLLDSKSILSHCIHLSDEDYAIANELECIVATNAESNANNLVGHMKCKYFNNYVLGTDGMNCDMIASLRAHYLYNKDCKDHIEQLHRALFSYRYEVQEKFFPKTGSFAFGNSADIAVLDYIPLSPISNENLLGHLVNGAKNSRTFMTVSNGQILYKNGEILFIEEDEIMTKAKQLAHELHKKYNK